MKLIVALVSIFIFYNFYTKKMMPKKDGFKIFYAISIALQLGFIIVFSIIGFLWLGIWMDKTFQSSPLFLITGVIVGITVTVYETYHLLIPLVKNNSKEDD